MNQFLLQSQSSEQTVDGRLVKSARQYDQSGKPIKEQVTTYGLGQRTTPQTEVSRELNPDGSPKTEKTTKFDFMGKPTEVNDKTVLQNDPLFESKDKSPEKLKAVEEQGKIVGYDATTTRNHVLKPETMNVQTRLLPDGDTQLSYTGTDNEGSRDTTLGNNGNKKSEHVKELITGKTMHESWSDYYPSGSLKSNRTEDNLGGPSTKHSKFSENGKLEESERTSTMTDYQNGGFKELSHEKTVLRPDGSYRTEESRGDRANPEMLHRRVDRPDGGYTSDYKSENGNSTSMEHSPTEGSTRTETNARDRTKTITKWDSEGEPVEQRRFNEGNSIGRKYLPDGYGGWVPTGKPPLDI